MSPPPSMETPMTCQKKRHQTTAFAVISVISIIIVILPVISISIYLYIRSSDSFLSRLLLVIMTMMITAILGT